MLFVLADYDVKYCILKINKFKYDCIFCLYFHLFNLYNIIYD